MFEGRFFFHGKSMTFNYKYNETLNKILIFEQAYRDNQLNLARLDCN